MDNWLILTIFLPLIGAGLVWLLGNSGRADVRQSALITSLVTLGLAAWFVAAYPRDGLDFAVSDHPWLGNAGTTVNIHFSLGLDGLSLWLFALSALLTVKICRE